MFQLAQRLLLLLLFLIQFKLRQQEHTFCQPHTHFLTPKLRNHLLPVSSSPSSSFFLPPCHRGWLLELEITFQKRTFASSGLSAKHTEFHLNLQTPNHQPACSSFAWLSGNCSPIFLLLLLLFLCALFCACPRWFSPSLPFLFSLPLVNNFLLEPWYVLPLLLPGNERTETNDACFFDFFYFCLFAGVSFSSLFSCVPFAHPSTPLRIQCLFVFIIRCFIWLYDASI